MKTKKLQFNCECAGCRNYAPDLAGIFRAEQIADKVQGHYLDRDTMRFFHSRIVSFAYDSTAQVLQVLTSNAGDYENTTRRYDVVAYCRWGSFIVEPDSMTGGAIRRTFTNTKKARADMTSVRACQAAATCQCHGCQLDRAGR